MRNLLIGIAILACSSCGGSRHLMATVRLAEFTNASTIVFQDDVVDLNNEPVGKLAEGLVIDQTGAVLTATDGSFRLILEDAHRSSYHRPHWKFQVWLETPSPLPFFSTNRILYAIFFYDGEGDLRLHLDHDGKLYVNGGCDVLYPWMTSPIGRGCAYHQISHNPSDCNGVTYFDYDGFVGYPKNYFAD